MASLTFTIYNYSSSTATLTSLNFSDPAGFSHTTNLSGLGGYLSSSTAFTGEDTSPKVDVLYVSDTSPLQKNFVKNTSTVYTIATRATATVSSSTIALVSTASIAVGDIVDAGGSYFNIGTVVTAIGSGTITVGTTPLNTISSGTNLTIGRYILVLSNTGGVKTSWQASSNGYVGVPNVYVSSVLSATWLAMTSGPVSAPTVGNPINFTTGSIELIVSDTTGISVGDRASGNGFSSNQTVTNVISSTKLAMSAYPSSTPVVGDTISFYHDQSITGLAPLGGNAPFVQEYSRSTAPYGTFQATILVKGLIDSTPVTRTVVNTLFVSAAPVTVTYDPITGGYTDTPGPGQEGYPDAPGGGPGDGPGTCGDGTASCSASASASSSSASASDGSASAAAAADGAAAAAAAADGAAAAAGDGAAGCYLTTAASRYKGLPDDCKELNSARMLRDNFMVGTEDTMLRIYDLVGPVLTARKKTWDDFFQNVIVPLTSLCDQGQHSQALKLYKIETVKLIDQYCTTYSDVEIINTIYKEILGAPVPYFAKYICVKTALKSKKLKWKLKYEILRKEIC